MGKRQKTMTAKASGSHKLKRSTLPKFNNDIYSAILPNDLIVYSAHYLLEQNIEIKLEDIVFACFLLFPQSFALKQFPKWPDSALVSRRLSDCRSKGYFAVNTDFGFKLTAKGSRIAERVAKALGVSTTKRIIKAAPSKPNKQTVISVKKVKSITGNKNKVITRKPSSLPKARVAIVKNNIKKVQKKKATSSTPIKSVQKSRTKVLPVTQTKQIIPLAPVKKALTKTSAVATPIKKAESPKIKAQPIIQVKKKLAIQKKKITPLVPAKKTSPIQPKKVAPTVTPVKQIEKPEIKKLAKKKPTVQKKKANTLAPAKKARLIGVKKVSSTPAPIKELKPARIKIQPVIQAKKKTVVQKQKVTPPVPVKKAEAPEIKAPPVVQAKKKLAIQKKKVTPHAPVKKIQPVRAEKTSPIIIPPTKQIQKAQTSPVTKPVAKEQSISPVEVILPKKHREDLQKKRVDDALKKRLSNVVPVQQITPTKNIKPVEPVIIQPIKSKKAQPAKVVSIAVIPASSEARERAGKFIRMMERSDAYVHYKKNGINSKINEFDFRSLLFCTMESSAETLVRNVELFKGYAELHKRQDLMTFLSYCEDKFSYLLKAQAKTAKKLRR